MYCFIAFISSLTTLEPVSVNVLFIVNIMMFVFKDNMLLNAVVVVVVYRLPC